MNKKNVEKVLKGVTLAGAAAFASTDVVFAEELPTTSFQSETIDVDIDNADKDEDITTGADVTVDISNSATSEVSSETKIFDSEGLEGVEYTETTTTTTTTTTYDVNSDEKLTGNSLSTIKNGVSVSDDEKEDVLGVVSPEDGEILEGEELGEAWKNAVEDLKNKEENAGEENKLGDYVVNDVTVSENGLTTTIELSKTTTTDGSLTCEELGRILGKEVKQDDNGFYYTENETRIDLVFDEKSSDSSVVETTETFEVKIETDKHEDVDEKNEYTSKKNFQKKDDGTYSYDDDVNNIHIKLVKNSQGKYVGSDVKDSVETIYELSETITPGTMTPDEIVAELRQELKLSKDFVASLDSEAGKVVFTNADNETYEVTFSDQEKVSYVINATRQIVKDGGNGRNDDPSFENKNEGVNTGDWNKASVYLLIPGNAVSDSHNDYVQAKDEIGHNLQISLDEENEYVKAMIRQEQAKDDWTETRIVNDGSALDEKYASAVKDEDEGKINSSLLKVYNKHKEEYDKRLLLNDGLANNKWNISFSAIEINCNAKRDANSEGKFHVDYGVKATATVEVAQNRIKIGLVTINLKDTYTATVSEKKTVETKRVIDETFKTVIRTSEVSNNKDSVSTSVSQSQSTSTSVSQSQSTSTSVSQSQSTSTSVSESQSVSTSVSESQSASASVSESQSLSTSLSESTSTSLSESTSTSLADSTAPTSENVPTPTPIVPIEDEDVPLEDLPEIEDEEVKIEDPEVPLNEVPSQETPDDEVPAEVDPSEDLNTIEDEEVPLAVQEEEENVTVADEEVPLSDNPTTGDVLPVGWIASAATAVSGLMASLKGKKKDTTKDDLKK